jgi:membrane dipeptidase
MKRREFLATAVAAVAPSRSRAQAAARREPVIDALGEIHATYDDALLDAMRASGLRACVVTVGNPALHDHDAAYADMKAEIELFDRLATERSTRLGRATSVAGIDRAVEAGTIAMIYYTQNAAPIGDDAARLGRLYGLGVRIVQLTYNTRNLLGDGCLERQNSGLSKLGVEVVDRMNGMKMLVDLSHCGEATTEDAIAVSKAPVSISHTGCKPLYDHPRNKADRTLRALADKGGVVGIYQINPYLGAKERNTLDDYLGHVDHAVKVAGIDHVGIGSDREHRTIPDTPEEKQKLIDELSRLRPVTAANFRWPFFVAELNHPGRMRTIADGLARRGYKGSDVDKILGANFYRLLRETIG